MTPGKSALQWLAVTTLAVLVAGCAEEIALYTPPAGSTVAVFDPAASPPAVPTPTDLVKDPATGLLKIPTPAGASRAQAAFDQFLDTLDGFPTSSVLEMTFSREIDATGVTDTTVPVYDITTASAPKRVTGLIREVTSLSVKGSAGEVGKRSRLRVFNPAGWRRGARYAALVLGGLKGVKDRSGHPVRRSSTFELVAGDSPLCEWNASYALNAKSGACEAPASGAVGTGCCTYNYATLLQARVEQSVTAKYKGRNDKSHAEIQREVRSAVIAAATSLERMRRGFGKVFASLARVGTKQDDLALMWTFSTVSLPQAVFDPSAALPRVPLPSDLIKDPRSGLITMPTAPGASAAEKAFNAYLSTLDGFVLSANKATVDFTDGLSKASVTSKGLRVAEVTATGLTPVTGAKVSYSESAKRATITLPGGLTRGQTYLALAVAGQDGLKTSTGKAPRRTAMMALTLMDDPLCTCGGKTCVFPPAGKDSACDKVLVNSFIDDPKGKSGGLTGVQKATRFERIRQGYTRLLALATAKGTVKKDEVAALWSFTATSMPELLYDPSKGVIPFPNNLLLDPTTGKVNLPAQSGETAAQKALRQGLNTLDGFTTLGSYYATYSGTLEPSSVKLGDSVLVLDLATGKPMTSWKVSVVATAPAIVATPLVPLAERHSYAIVLLSRFKSGSQKPGGGLRDSTGRRVVAAPFMALLRSKSTLYKDNKSTISTLDDASARSAEQARKAHMALFAALDARGISRLDVVGAWTFTTQTITQPLTRLRALPYVTLAALDGNLPAWTGTLDPTLTGMPATVPRTHLAGWVAQGSFDSWFALDPRTGALLASPSKGKKVSVPMILTLPKGTMPAAGWPVVLFQHGLTRAKTDVLAVADTLAAAGFATVAFDVIYHGARSVCTRDSHCDQGGVVGTCDTTVGSATWGTCTKGKLAVGADGVPLASGAYFLNTQNPFAVRDNMRQHVIDAAALLRGLALGAAAGIVDGASGTSGKVKLDASMVDYVGQSLGSILGTLVLATTKLPRRAVLNVPGAPMVDIIFTAPSFKSIKDDILKAQNVKEGSLDYLRLLTTFKWILDPADPANFARYVQLSGLPDATSTTGAKVPTKQVLVQLAGKDKTIPVALGSFLARQMGVSTAVLARTTYPNQGHGFLLSPDPKSSLAATKAAQTQMAMFLVSGTICTPNTTTGTCR